MFTVNFWRGKQPVGAVKDIISGIPLVDTDLLTKLRERMAAQHCSLTLRLMTEDQVMKFI